MGGPNLQNLPDELIERVLDELDPSAFPNPFHSLVLVSERFSRIALPYLYESITIRSYAQLESLVDQESSGAWKLPPCIKIKHLCMIISSPDLLILFMDNADIDLTLDADPPVSQKLHQLFSDEFNGSLQTMSVVVDYSGNPAFYANNSLLWFYPKFVTLQARRIEYTYAGRRAGQSGYNHDMMMITPWDELAAFLERNPRLQELRIPFIIFYTGMGPTRVRLTKLRLDWPVGLDNEVLERLLDDVIPSLEEKGLVIAAQGSGSGSLLELQQDFHTKNSGVNPSHLRASLASRGADVDGIMSKLDWRIEPTWPESQA